MAVQAGAARGAQRTVERTTRLLRSWAENDRDIETQEALLDSLDLSLELAHARGDLALACSLGREILSVLGQCERIDRLLDISARTCAATALIYSEEHAVRCEHELWDCYASAVRYGLGREAIIIATRLAAYFRLRRQAARALELLEPLLDRARIVTIGDSRGGFFCEFVAACVETGALAKAVDFLPELRKCAASNPALLPAADLIASEIHLAQKNFEEALAAAESAETGYVRLAGDRLVGAALRLQAESLAGLGRIEQARASQPWPLSVCRTAAIPSASPQRIKRWPLLPVAAATHSPPRRFAPRSNASDVTACFGRLKAEAHRGARF